MFIDTARITVKAGKGGNGVNSFYRDKLNVNGYPDGGDGGNGGNVIIRVSTNVHTLVNFRHRQLFKAKDAFRGGSQKKHGRNGEDLIMEVPAGTLIYDAGTKGLLKDLVKEGDQFIAAAGGEGGRGNKSHKDATLGQEGETKELFFELKLIADVGIIGLPNAGKSSLISRISKAHPRIAAFAFTTKDPVLGVVEYDDIKFKVAEIPGLIEGSYRGKGLGDKFLRHAERTKFFIHLIDISKGTAEEALLDYEKINKELALYSKKLGEKNQIIAANKIDIEGTQEILTVFKAKINKEVFAISAKEGIGIEELIKKIRTVLEHEPSCSRTVLEG